MRAAMAQASVGDEQLDEDPSVNELVARVSTLLGKQKALFLPSGTMCNLIAVLVHCRPGDEIIAADNSHLISSESAGATALAGAQIRPVPAERGIFSAEQVAIAVRPQKVNAPTTRLIHVEQTVNRGGGAIWPIDVLRDLARFSRERGLAMHIDGARLMNAVVGSGVDAKDYGDCCDSVWLDLSKGLGCPMGAVLAGSDEFIEAARRWKFRLGGAMRQAGIVAAAGLYALENNVSGLQTDHQKARRFADALSSHECVLVGNPETNLVFFEINSRRMNAAQLAHELALEGIGIGVESATLLRAVTHLDVSTANVDEAAATICRILR